MNETPIRAKKKKLDTAAEAKKEWPPAYGSQTYWEERYQKNLRVGTNDEGDAESDVIPYHPWYFTYQELSPLILPIIIGSYVEDEMEHAEDETTTTLAEVGKELVAQNDDSEDSNDDEEDEDGEQEVSVREGLAKVGPISIIEIGCGDVPLGKDLALELANLQETTGSKANKVVKEIVCCDYSATVIYLCKENQRREVGDMLSHGKPFLVDYVTADARKLQYPDCRFHLVLEKGTLDAMLSDKETGVDSSTRIMMECARVLKEGGYIILVSHLNAHTESGIDWLNTVVIAGLRAGGGKYSRWEIEVHGSDVNDSSECYKDETNHVDDGQESERGEVVQGEEDHQSTGEESDGDEGSAPPSSDPPSGGPGPAVYIIHNLSKASSGDSTEGTDPPAVRLQFFGY